MKCRCEEKSDESEPHFDPSPPRSTCYTRPGDRIEPRKAVMVSLLELVQPATVADSRSSSSQALSTESVSKPNVHKRIDALATRLRRRSVFDSPCSPGLCPLTLAEQAVDRFARSRPRGRPLVEGCRRRSKVLVLPAARRPPRGSRKALAGSGTQR